MLWGYLLRVKLMKTNAIHKLEVDIETFSEANLPDVGVYRYVNDPSFEIMILTYSIDNGALHQVDLASGEEITDEFYELLHDPSCIKYAYNAQFERLALGKMYSEEGWLDPQQWHDTMVTANEMSLPTGLGRVASWLHLDEQKDTRGRALINYFAKPCKPTKANGGRTRNMPSDAPDKWQTYLLYNRQDVATELAIDEALSKYPVSDQEWSYYTLDQLINDRGVEVDQDLAHGAVAIMDELNARGAKQLKELTGLDNPNSVKQFKEWLEAQNCPFKTLGKDTVQSAIDQGNLPDRVTMALKLRLSLSNSSTKKYEKMIMATCDDGRVHGLLQFYGANRTGRWAGRLVQVQNLPRNYLSLDQLKVARELIKDRDIVGLEMLFDSPQDVIKQSIRTAFVPKEGYHLAICDFSAIEARTIAWIAGENWALKEFEQNADIYKSTASRMLGIPKEKIDKKIRQKGKITTLALGYQGSVGAMLAMGAKNLGLDEEELPSLVKSWRKANPHIVKLWYAVQDMAMAAIEDGGVHRCAGGRLKAYMKQGYLFIEIPSGRKLAYAKAAVNEDGRITYYGQGMKAGFIKLETYGGKLVENITQATARDLLAFSMKKLDEAGYHAVFHVHDEVVAEVPAGKKLDEMERIMCQGPDWATGLPLNAAGYTTPFYRKD